MAVAGVQPVSYTVGPAPSLEDSKKRYVELELRKISLAIAELSRQLQLISAAIP